MTSTFSAEAAKRRTLRRLALYTFLVFLVASTVIHFTVGSIVAMLLPKEKPSLDQAITIVTLNNDVHEAMLTIEHLQPDPQKPTPQTVTPQKIVMRPMPHIQRTMQRTTVSASSAVASIDAPSRRSSSPAGGGARQQQSASRGSFAQAISPMGSSGAAAQTGNSGEASGEEVSFPGRQIPTGAVWTESGPAGQSGSGAGGITLGGGTGGGGMGGGHDSCSPSRGGFF